MGGRRGRGRGEEEVVKYKTTRRNPGVRIQRNQMSDLETFLKRGDMRGPEALIIVTEEVEEEEEVEECWAGGGLFCIFFLPSLFLFFIFFFFFFFFFFFIRFLIRPLNCLRFGGVYESSSIFYRPFCTSTPRKNH